MFVIGESYGAGNYDFATLAYDAQSGARLWVATYNGAGNGDDSPKGVAVSADGSRVFVAGSSIGSGTGSDIAAISYNAVTGQAVWTSRYDSGTDQGLSGGPPGPNSVSLSPDGTTLYVVGTTDDDALLVAFDTTDGQIVWTARDPDDGEDKMFGAGMTPDGSTMFLVGHRRPAGGNSTQDDMLTVAFDLVNRRIAWKAFYDGPSNLSDDALRVAVSPDGSRVFVTGQSNSALNQSNGSDYATIAYDVATGNEVWARRYAGDNIANAPYGIGADPRGRFVFVTGTSWGNASRLDALTIAYDAANGAEVWVTRVIDGPTQFGWGQPVVAASGGNRVYVSGYGVDTSNRYKFTTFAYDAATGAQIWKQNFPVTPAADQGYADYAALSPSGDRLFVTGPYIANQEIAADFGIIGYGPFSIPPVATLDANPTSGPPPLAVTFTTSANDTDGTLDWWGLDVDGDHAQDYSGAGAPPASLSHTYTAAGTFRARLTVSDDHGAVGSDTVTVVVSGPPVSVPLTQGGGHGLALRSFPNPLRVATTIAFALPEPGHVELSIHDLRGRLVRTLMRGERAAGSHSVAWDGRDGRGRPVPAGVYAVRLGSGVRAGWKKVAVVR